MNNTFYGIKAVVLQSNKSSLDWTHWGVFHTLCEMCNWGYNSQNIMQIKYHPFVFTSDFSLLLDPYQIQGLSR